MDGVDDVGDMGQKNEVRQENAMNAFKYLAI